MKKSLTGLSILSLFLLLLAGCSPIGAKAASLSAIYGAAAVLSLLLLVGYYCIASRKDKWYLLLFASVLVVNTGYYALSISRGLNEALMANRLSYLGSVFLPLSMLMIILNATHIRCKKWVPGSLVGLAAVVFLIAASPGYLPIYYKDVSFVTVNGAAALEKVYGPLHSLYLVYLLGYFSAMVTIIVHTTLHDQIDSLAYAVIIAIAVFVNIGVWMVEQLVYIEFEILSISYIISECFLLGLHILMAEAEKQKDQPPCQSPEPQPEIPAGTPAVQEAAPSAPKPEDPDATELFLAGLATLTPKERQLYECYVAGMTTDVIMEQLCIKENTLKFHSKNLYGKLGVRSRKQLMERHRIVSAENLLPQNI